MYELRLTESHRKKINKYSKKIIKKNSIKELVAERSLEKSLKYRNFRLDILPKA